MNKQLLKDLAELEAHEVITADTSERIKSFYKQRQQDSPNRGGIVLAILGALLAGSGIILIIAHNWDDFSKLTKTIFGLLPLLATQALAAYTLLKQKDNKAWRECSAILLFFAIPSTISVISQVYQIEGDLGGFLLTWTLLALPLVYVLSSSVVALLCIATATWYVVEVGYFNGPSSTPYLYLPMIGFLAAHYYTLVKSKPKSNLVLLMNFFLCISVTVVLGTFFQGGDNWYPLFYAIYLLLFCILYKTGKLLNEKHHPMSSRPFHVTGITGVLVILFIWSFKIRWERLDSPVSIELLNSPISYGILVLTVVLGVLIFKSQSVNKDWKKEAVEMSFLVFILSLLLFTPRVSFGIFTINLWILFLAVTYIMKGSRESNLGVLNFGLSIIGTLALCRFFDDSIPFVWRGIFFLLTGIAFFVMNYLVMNRRKALNKSL